MPKTAAPRVRDPATEAKIAAAWSTIIESLGYDADDAHMADSPARVARFFSEWHTTTTQPPKLTTFPNEGYDQMVLVGGIRFHSVCAG